jgi:hypothetical protein
MSDVNRRPSSAPALRVADSEREAAAEVLRTAVEEGRLDLDELDERLAMAYGAKTRAELERVTADLPAPEVSPEPEPLQLQTKSGSLKKDGHWTVPRRISAECTSGSITFDFTEATCHHRLVEIEATAKSGSVVLVVPLGWSVDLDRCTATSGSIVNKVREAPKPGAPVLRVTGSVRSGTIKARYRRRGFWAWLFRRPRTA